MPKVILPPDAPPPDNDPIVSVLPLTSKIAPDVFAITTSLVSGITLLAPIFKVPPLIVVLPV